MEYYYSSDSDDELELLSESSNAVKWWLLSTSRTHYIHAVNKQRQELGEYHHLFLEYKSKFPERFFNYMRMTVPTFEYLLDGIKDDLQKSWKNCHLRPIAAEERLVVTLRHLAEGMSFKSLSHAFRMGASTVANIVKEVVHVLWIKFQPVHLPVPTHEDFKKISDEFFELWQFPHCLGAIDGKHIRIKCPPNSGTMFYNYKNYFSVILQGVADANCRFTIIDVGGYGKQSDGGTFRNMLLYKGLTEGTLNIPDADPLPNTNTVMPYVFIANEAYPLLKNLLKPYSRSELNFERETFNKRLSRARKCVERAFGIITAKWRILNRPIESKVDTADELIKAICLLHNVIIDKEGIPSNSSEIEIVPSGRQGGVTASGRPAAVGKDIRDAFKTYFSTYPLMYN